ncbi:hypothetical protein DsansV1_C30g0216051 [Dioscorea sansibarensis]
MGTIDLCNSFHGFLFGLLIIHGQDFEHHLLLNNKQNINVFVLDVENIERKPKKKRMK